jgi:hypothetical protein
MPKWLLAIPLLAVTASAAVAAEPGGRRDQGYERLVEQSPAFRAERARRECDPIRDDELRRLCINSLLLSGATDPRAVQQGALPTR